MFVGYVYLLVILDDVGTGMAAISDRRSFPRQAGARTGRTDMSDPSDKKNEILPDAAKQAKRPDEPMEDEEKIMAGRNDVNYPAMLTKDVPGG
jgi:hypothetical protein